MSLTTTGVLIRPHYPAEAASSRDEGDQRRARASLTSSVAVSLSMFRANSLSIDPF